MNEAKGREKREKKDKKALNVEIGKRVRCARDVSGMTQEKLAEAINVSVQYVSDLERGVVGIAVPTLMQLCRTLNASCDYILFDEKGTDNEKIMLLTRLIRRFSPEQRELAEKLLTTLAEAFSLEEIETDDAAAMDEAK